MRLFWLIVLVPLALAVWLGVKVAHDERALERHELERLLEGRLVDVRSRAGQAVGRLERELLEALASAPTDVEGLRAMGRKTPLARQIFVMGADGQLVFPARTTDASQEELEFLARTEAIWAGKAVLFRDPGGEDGVKPAPPQPAANPSVPGDSLIHLAATSPSGWISWYWQEGLHLLFWRRSEAGRVVGLEVERVALLSRIVAALPTTELEEGRMRLADSRGEVVHQWGPHDVGDEVARAVLSFEHPLDSWRLEYFIAPSQRRAFEGGIRLDVIFGVGAVAIALLGLAIYTHREMSRRVRDASQRVSFVTQVSHELKTPLTNIRLYAELLEDRLGDRPDEEDGDNARRARVIVSESRRLTRLINNILTFARARRGDIETRPVRVDPNRVVGDILEQFGPALAARDIEVTAQLDATRSVRADEDALDQVLANLVSNVEKYAASGGVLRIETADRGDHIVIRVSDRGPGIARGQREAVFKPFYRVSDRLADGVTGTGIGLSIARELVDSMGGELRLVDAEVGASFEVVLAATSMEDDGEGTRS